MNLARSANRPVTLFNAVTLHGKFTFNSSQLTIKLIDIYNFCNVICFLKSGYFYNVWQQQVQRPLPACGRCAQAKTQTQDTINTPTLRSIYTVCPFYGFPP
jgi:hypothetical protein